MDILNEIRQTGFEVATLQGVIGEPKIEEIPHASEVVDDFVCRVMDDLFEFATMEGFDGDTFNLFSRAFMYMYGKGAEFAFFTRAGNDIDRISYDFNEAMRGTGATRMPDYIRMKLFSKSSAMLDMYVAMFDHTRGSQERLINAGLSLPKCLYVMLSGAFYYGRERVLTIELSDEEETAAFGERADVAYDYDTYDQRYSASDYQVVNYRIG